MGKTKEEILEEKNKRCRELLNQLILKCLSGKPIILDIEGKPKIYAPKWYIDMMKEKKGE